MKIGLVTCRKESQLIEIDRKMIPIFQSNGIEAIPVVWNEQSVDWKNFDYLILRSVWDYHLNSEAFLNWLDLLDLSDIPLFNPTSIIRKNHHKFYLRQLEEAGFPIVPTLFISQSEHFNLNELKEINWNKYVIKPAISASSFLTEFFEFEEIKKIENQFKSSAKERDFLIQEFMPEVQTHGELSILFFNRKYSHSVLKTATKNEFRVQEEFGGITRSINPSPEIITQAGNILSNFEGNILQARVDGVVRDGTFILMEMELIEPHLFFEFNEDTLNTFVDEAIELIK